MSRQPISLGTAANDGTGDNLRSGATKINANTVELFIAIGGDSDQLPDRIVRHRNAVITGSGALATNIDYYIFNSGSPIAATLPAGSYVGEYKVFTNRGAGLATVTANLAGASVSFALAQNEGTQVIWDGSEWFVVGNQSIVTLA